MRRRDLVERGLSEVVVLVLVAVFVIYFCF